MPEPIEPHLRVGEVLDASADLVLRGWPLTVAGILRNADDARSRFTFNGRKLVAVSAEATVGGRTVDQLLAGTRLRTRRRYASVRAHDLLEAGFALLPTFAAPHYSVVLLAYSEAEARRLVDVLRDSHQRPLRRRPTMSDQTRVRVTLPADVAQIDQTGYVWTFLDRADEPERVVAGALIVAGDEEEPFLARVVDVVADPSGRRIVHLDVVGVPAQAIDELRHARLLAG